MAIEPDLTPEYIAAYNGDKLVIVASTMIPVVVVFVSLRFYARYLRKATWALDDTLALISMVFLIALSAFCISFVKYGGVGRHFAAWEEIEPSMTTKYFKFLLAGSFYYFFSVAWPKLTILAFYFQVFPAKLYRYIIYATAGVVAAAGIVCPIMALNLCRPFAYNWDRTIEGGKCVNEQAFYMWGSLPNIITDFVMLVLPLPVVWNLQTTLKVKTGLTVAFAIGGLGLATSIVRFVSFSKGSAVIDGTWDSVDFLIWTIIEPDVYLIAACMINFRPILTHLLGRSGKNMRHESSDSQQKLYNASEKASTGKASSKSHVARLPDESLFDDADDGADGLYPHPQCVTTLGRSEQQPSDDLEQGRIFVLREYGVTNAPSKL